MTKSSLIQISTNRIDYVCDEFHIEENEYFLGKINIILDNRCISDLF